jgi:dihydrofolate reductase
MLRRVEVGQGTEDLVDDLGRDPIYNHIVVGYRQIRRAISVTCCVHEKGTTTMKLTTITNVSVDGVMQGLGGADEDRRGGFERGGWAMPLFDNDAESFLSEIYERADAFLFGRWTYEVFANSWGTIEEMRKRPIGIALNSRPKYVASSTVTDPQWAGTTVLSGDLAAAIGELKTKPGGELQVHGGGVLIRWLLENSLVDEITLFTYPVVVGQGTRLFPDAGPDIALDLVDSRAFSKGITTQVYRPAGRPQYAT